MDAVTAGPPLAADPEPLVVAPCSHDAARYAVMHWHYSRRMPAGKLVKFGVWEHGAFVGTVLYGRGATPKIGSPYGLNQTEICELVRVALTDHSHTVTAILARSLGQLSTMNPGLRLVVSFADTGQGHHGGIYQAGNWLYLGTVTKAYYRVRGELVHPRTLYARYGVGGQSVRWLRDHVDPDARKEDRPAKHRYVYPLDRGMRRKITKIALPYPARGEVLNGSVDLSRDEGRVRSPGTAPTEATS